MSSEIYTLYPIKHENIFELYKKATASFWLPEDIDITEDKKDWILKLTQKEKEYIKYILGFFASSDGVVMENLVTDFYTKTTNAEGRNFYAFQIAMEAIHSEVYSLLIDTYIQDENEKKELFAATEHMPVIKSKVEWALKWITKEYSWEQRLVAFAIVEGIFFSGAFCSIYWLNDRGLMPGLSLSNALIARDEASHTDHACEQYALVPENKKIPKTTILQMIQEAINIENDFIDDALKFNLPGMNSKLMKQYVRYVADRLLTSLKCNKIYHDSNPFPFMEKISMDAHINFFEGRNAQYQRSNIMEVYKQRMNGRESGNNYSESDILAVLNDFVKDNNIEYVDVNTWYKKYKNNKEKKDSDELQLSDDF